LLLVFAASRSRRRSRATFAGSLVGLALLLVGCSNPGSVNDYNADTRENFMLACADANTGLDDAQRDEVCGCWYDALSGDNGLSFEEFETVEDDIRTALDANQLNSDEDLDRIAPNFVRVIDDSGCLTAGPRAG
jgi:hypothetical protein